MKPLSRTFLAAVSTLLFTLACGGYTIAKVEDVAPSEDQPAPGAPTPSPAIPVTNTATPTPAQPVAPTAPAPVPARVSSGQIQVTTMAAVQAVVDGVPVAFDMNQGYVLDVPPGSHSLEIVNLLGRPVATQTVNVPSGKRVRYNYRKKILSSAGTVPYSKVVAAPVPTPAPTAPTPAVLGSAQLDGFTPLTDRVWVNGREVPYDQTRAGYVVRALSAGEHNLRVERSGQVVYQGALGIRNGENHRCIAVLGSDWRWTLSCHYTTPQL